MPDTSQTTLPSWTPDQAGTNTEEAPDTISMEKAIANTAQTDVPLSRTPTLNTDEVPLDGDLHQNLMGMNMDLCSPEAKSSTISHFKMHIASTLSVKTVQWNIFTYFLEADHQSRESPIRCSIIALAAVHRGLEDQSVPNEYLVYYARACASLDRLFSSFVADGQLPADQLEIIFATVYLLSHCDIIVCNAAALSTRLERMKNIIQKQWRFVSPILSGVSARLLLWLGYLDARRSMLQHSTVETAASEHLLSIIGKQKDLPRLYLSSRLYLKEAFGQRYPSLELQNDMVHDPVNLKFAEAMSVLGQILHQARVASTGCSESDSGFNEELYQLYSKLVDLESVSLYYLSAGLNYTDRFRNAILLYRASTQTAP